jgi:hypothetical protein
MTELETTGVDPSKNSNKEVKEGYNRTSKISSKTEGYFTGTQSAAVTP